MLTIEHRPTCVALHVEGGPSYRITLDQTEVDADDMQRAIQTQGWNAVTSMFLEMTEGTAPTCEQRLWWEDIIAIINHRQEDTPRDEPDGPVVVRNKIVLPAELCHLVTALTEMVNRVGHLGSSHA